MATIFHLALAGDWADAQSTGTYAVSTVGRTLAEEGFLHAARGDQWQAVRERYYAEVTEPLVLLRIDTDRLDVPVVDEPASAGGKETFPHIYGPLPVGAVVAVIPLSSPSPAADQAPAPAPARPRPTTGPSPQASFSAVYFREMFTNAALILLVVALGFTGILVGSAIEADAGPGIGGIIGTASGVVAAVILHRRRT